MIHCSCLQYVKNIYILNLTHPGLRGGVVGGYKETMAYKSFHKNLGEPLSGELRVLLAIEFAQGCLASVIMPPHFFKHKLLYCLKFSVELPKNIVEHQTTLPHRKKPLRFFSPFLNPN
jgi:hypothetical protein